MDCPNCKIENPDQAIFCMKCGSPLQTTNDSPTAPPPASSTGQDVQSSDKTWRMARAARTKWIVRMSIPLAILAWIALVAVIVWAASHVVRSLILLAIAALLALALAPAVKFVARIMPRLLAILVVYFIVLTGLSLTLYLVTKTTIGQVLDLKSEVMRLLNPDPTAPLTPLEVTLRSLGIERPQIQEARQVIVSQLSNLVSDAVSFLKGLFDFVLDVLVVAMLSIYFLLDGARMMRWLRDNLPLQQRSLFLLDTLEQVLGGYVRSQFILSFLIALLVGVGMALLQVPHALLLGVLAFFLAFIPVLGTFLSAAACLLLAATQHQGWIINLTHLSWALPVVVLIYFVAVHLFESHIVGPRLVGQAVGLHPIVSISALIAGAELFGILGALFVAPVVGVAQAVIVSLWKEWKLSHPELFVRAANDPSGVSEPVGSVEEQGTQRREEKPYSE